MSPSRLDAACRMRAHWRNALRSALLITGTALMSTFAQAQTVAPDVALPFYTTGHFMKGLYRYWYAPRSEEFAKRATALPDAIAALCDAEATAGSHLLQRARAQWQTTVGAWDLLSSVQIGPLVERRSARQIDFTPTRPELIDRAIQTAPANAEAMALIGTPAKGLPALEWLLWNRPMAPRTPACRYAVQVATDVGREAASLSASFGELATNEFTDEGATGSAMSELVNQWVGGLERLRWTDMEKPALRAKSAANERTAARNVGYPRSASAQTAATWMARWQALRALAIATENDVPLPDMALVPLETYLRGRGLNPLADKLARRIAKADESLATLSPPDLAGVSKATRELAQLKKLVEEEVAPALEVHIGFSDADGD